MLIKFLAEIFGPKKEFIMTTSNSNEFKTDQEVFWAGNFGSEYVSRNIGDQLLASNLSLFSKILAQTDAPKTAIEFGANIGMNLKALRLLYPEQEQHAVEINNDAVAGLRENLTPEHVYHESILTFEPNNEWELVLIKGVLIHINPDMLQMVYQKLVKACSRYLIVAEYYNPSPVSIPYRGHNDRLFKRDFAGEILDAHPEMKLLNYGFVYSRDLSFPQDDITWFLLEKVKPA